MVSTATSPPSCLPLPRVQDTTTTNAVPYSTTPTNSEHYTTIATNGEPYTTTNDENNNIPYTHYNPNKNNNNYYNNNYKTNQNGMSDTRFTVERLQHSHHHPNHPNSNNYYNVERQGMSDTRFLENGKYYYDPNNKNNYNQNQYKNSFATCTKFSTLIHNVCWTIKGRNVFLSDLVSAASSDPPDGW
ncbi:protein E6-like [Rosa chinensis]|uniref:protein E6-like n=1 Tax=Rosa chinensis TaxID=74649 RepID=UPI000D0966FA|nr:protein E6-like [Rosa chinensis]